MMRVVLAAVLCFVDIVCYSGTLIYIHWEDREATKVNSSQTSFLPAVQDVDYQDQNLHLFDFSSSCSRRRCHQDQSLPRSLLIPENAFP